MQAALGRRFWRYREQGVGAELCSESVGCSSPPLFRGGTEPLNWIRSQLVRGSAGPAVMLFFSACVG